MSKCTWNRPSGTQITTNDEQATIDHCVSLGWELLEEAPAEGSGEEAEEAEEPEPAQAPRRGRK